MFMPAEAAEPGISRRAADLCGGETAARSPNAIFGICRVRLKRSFSFMHVYSAEQRRQIEFWDAMLDYVELDGMLFEFAVSDAIALPHKVVFCLHMFLYKQEIENRESIISYVFHPRSDLPNHTNFIQVP